MRILRPETALLWYTRYGWYVHTGNICREDADLDAGSGCQQWTREKKDDKWAYCMAVSSGCKRPVKLNLEYDEHTEYGVWSMSMEYEVVICTD